MVEDEEEMGGSRREEEEEEFGLSASSTFRPPFEDEEVEEVSRKSPIFELRCGRTERGNEGQRKGFLCRNY